MADTPEKMGLETFLAALPEQDAVEARVAAARIDSLEREIGPPGWIERNMWPLAGGAFLLFILGMVFLIGIFAWGRTVLGLGGVVLLICAFPALMLAYLWSVRGRTAADHEKMALNEKYFLPHQGIYFGGGTVVRVNWTKRELNLREQVEARHAEVTKRRG
jgi:hypothetical protein